MKFFSWLLAALALLAVTPAQAVPLRLHEQPVVASRVDARSICHHYRWSSQRRCTSAKTLRYVARPPLFYPSRYFGGTPHYYYARPTYHWRTYPGYAHHRWYRWPYRRY